jgi:hypothetical protein
MPPFIRSVFAACILSMLSVVPAFASGGEAKDAADPSVKLASVAIPVFKGRNVVNYLFLSIKINLTLKADQGKLRDMEPYFRNVLIRSAHKTSFAMADRDDKLDEARFKAVMKAEFTKVAGAGTIESVEVVSQSPKRHR